MSEGGRVFVNGWFALPSLDIYTLTLNQADFVPTL